tara:strand:- start:2555 stop:2809 length:255 start_codon:yes stop_codon:yes gene_type:complete
MAGYINSRVDLELDGDDIMAAIMDDVTDAARQTIHEEAATIIELCDEDIRDIARDVVADMDIVDEISNAVSRELENYEIVFVRK